MKDLTPTIQAMIGDRGVNGRLVLDFDGLDLFGSPEEARVIYMKLNEEGDQFKLFRDINSLIIGSCLKYDLLEKHELSHIDYDYKTD